MKDILILFAHPRLERSKINRTFLEHLPQEPWLTVRDLYELYPGFNVDVRTEKEVLLAHDIVVWHHPFYWYSAPPLLKQWIDMVLEFGWAYGPGGTALQGKWVFNAITTGGAREAYAHDGRNRFTIAEFLTPFNQTAQLCKMSYLPPFAVQGTHRLSDEAIGDHAEHYVALLHALHDGSLDEGSIAGHTFLNDIPLDQFKGDV